MPALRHIAAPVAVFIIAACGYDSPTGSSNAPPPPAQNSATDISIMPGGAFSPNPKTVALNGAANVTIRWVNRDYSGSDYSTTTVTHKIQSDDNPPAFSPSGNLDANSLTFSIQLSAPGDYPYSDPTSGQNGSIHIDP